MKNINTYIVAVDTNERMTRSKVEARTTQEALNLFYASHNPWHAPEKSVRVRVIKVNA